MTNPSQTTTVRLMQPQTRLNFRKETLTAQTNKQAAVTGY